MKDASSFIPEVIHGLKAGEIKPEEAVTRILSCFGYVDERQRRLHAAYVAEMIEDVMLGETSSEMAIVSLSEAASASRA